ncbi:hypothetical protein NQ318_020498 [Aromia moschata]|uniref:Uncharacterized protein n=1 Tax=Aromia moschata TaxID=1265417 RepID=A0AAV8YBJ5_9CUCU|nr:hypothetical protein NQ318_020498 [Aromia moschata]
MEVYMCGYCTKEVGDILKHGCFKFYEESIYDIVVNDEMVMMNGKGQMEIFEGPIGMKADQHSELTKAVLDFIKEPVSQTSPDLLVLMDF